MATTNVNVTIDATAIRPRHIIFLAPSIIYARAVVKNLADDLNKKGVAFNSSNINTFNEPWLKTNHVSLTFVYSDPVIWTAATFAGADMICGKKALVETLRKNPFSARAHLPIHEGSPKRYIFEIESEFDQNYEILNGAKPKTSYIPNITNAYFNPPFSIVLWDDGTKTIVTCQDDDAYSDEVGLAMCIAKKALGNKGNYNDIFKKWIPEIEEEEN